jgi:DNA polymerase III psi subunit
MENTSHLALSDYQRAILNEMGISSWLVSSEEQNQAKTDNQINDTVDSSSEIVPKVDALAKLKQLKVQTQTNKITDSVLVTCSQSDTRLNVFTDVLIALGLESKELKLVSIDQLSHYVDYPLSWTQGDEVSFQNKQLITPALVELTHSDTKKQLWQQLQSALSLAKQ